MKTKRKYKAPILLTSFFAVLLYLIVINSFYKTDKPGILIISFLILFSIILYSLSRIVQIEINNGTLSKHSFIYKRSLKLNSIKIFKISLMHRDSYWAHAHQYEFILKALYGKSYYSLRRLKVYYENGLGRMTFDERTMTKLEFDKLISEVKKGRSKFHKRIINKQITR